MLLLGSIYCCSVTAVPLCGRVLRVVPVEAEIKPLGPSLVSWFDIDFYIHFPRRVVCVVLGVQWILQASLVPLSGLPTPLFSSDRRCEVGQLHFPYITTFSLCLSVGCRTIVRRSFVRPHIKAVAPSRLCANVCPARLLLRRSCRQLEGAQSAIERHIGNTINIRFQRTVQMGAWTDPSSTVGLLFLPFLSWAW